VGDLRAFSFDVDEAGRLLVDGPFARGGVLLVRSTASWWCGEEEEEEKE
jgi:hypothetical protein